MTTITATTNPAEGSISLHVQSLETVNGLTRTDANGEYPVRVPPGTFPYVPVLEPGRRNLAPNPAAGGNIVTGWTSRECTVTAEDGAINGDGPLYFRATIDALSGGNLQQRVDYNPRPLIEAGKPYTLSLWMRVKGGPREVYAQFYFFDASGSAVSGPHSTPPHGSSAWNRLSVTATAPAGAETVLMRFGLPNQNAWAVGDFFDYGGVLLEQSSSVLPYFDGDTLSSTDAAYRWEGTPYQSVSLAEGDSYGLMLTDHEAAHGQVTYEAGDASTGTTLVLDRPVLLVPRTGPAQLHVFEQLSNFTSSRSTTGTVHEIDDRPADPVISIGKLRTRAGSMELWCVSYAEARTLESVLESGQIAMLKQEHAGMDLYFYGSNTVIAPFNRAGERTRWRLTISYREVPRPDGDLL